MKRLPGEIDGQRVLRALGRLGWTVVKQRGSHRKLMKQGGGMLIVAFHNKLGRQSVRRILRQAGISEEEFLQAL